MLTYLSVAVHSVRVNEVLETSGVLVKPVESWWIFCVRHRVQDWWNCGSRSISTSLQSLLDDWNIIFWHPALSNQRLLSHVKAEQVQAVVDCFDFPDLGKPKAIIMKPFQAKDQSISQSLPKSQVLRSCSDQSFAVLFGLTQHRVQVVQASVDTINHLPPLGCSFRTRIARGMVSFTNLSNPGLQLLALIKDHEHRFSHWLARAGVNHVVVNISKTNKYISYR